MLNKEILERAISRAIDGGWKAKTYSNGLWLKVLNEDGEPTSHYHFQTWDSPSILFSHDFARALWGETEDLPWANAANGDEAWYSNDWRGHLQQMVIAIDPIRYLGEHLPE